MQCVVVCEQSQRYGDSMEIVHITGGTSIEQACAGVYNRTLNGQGDYYFSFNGVKVIMYRETRDKEILI